jgi:hypothetical protein
MHSKLSFYFMQVVKHFWQTPQGIAVDAIIRAKIQRRRQQNACPECAIRPASPGWETATEILVRYHLFISTICFFFFFGNVCSWTWLVSLLLLAPISGCETNLMNDLSNCGSCGKSCRLDNANSACVDGKCTLVSCLSKAFGDCDQKPENGCESFLVSKENCGACGKACRPNEFCSVAGACLREFFCGVSACLSGYVDS